MTRDEAERFAQEWIEAWNSHDLERILTHYSEDVEVTSPFVETVLGRGRDTVKGKATRGVGEVAELLASAYCQRASRVDHSVRRTPSWSFQCRRQPPRAGS